MWKKKQRDWRVKHWKSGSIAKEAEFKLRFTEDTKLVREANTCPQPLTWVWSTVV